MVAEHAVVRTDWILEERAPMPTYRLWSRPARIGFIIERAPGDGAAHEQFKRAVKSLETVEARWVDIGPFVPDGSTDRDAHRAPGFCAGGRALFDAWSALHGWPYDVLIVNAKHSAMLCQCVSIGRPTILMMDTTPRQDEQGIGLRDRAPVMDWLTRSLVHQAHARSFRRARALVPSSEWARRSLVEDYGVPPKQAQVIPAGVNTLFWRPGEDRSSTDRVQIITVDGSDARSGYRPLLDVFRGLGLQDRADLHIVTRAPVDPAPGVIVHRDVSMNSPELLRLTQRSDLFVLPTHGERAEIRVISAMAAGLPVIITATGGMPEVVEHGVSGYLIRPTDAPGLADALHRLVNDPISRRAFGAAARHRAVMRFDARTNAAKLIGLAHGLADPESA